MRPSVLSLFALAGMSACLNTGEEAPAGSVRYQLLPSSPSFIALANLPQPTTNNAVAGVKLDGRIVLFSFLGLGPGKTWQDTRSSAWQLTLTTVAAGIDARSGTWQQLADVPGGVGRLAATATSVHGKVFIFGGYSVAEDGSEKSVPLVHMLDPERLIYEARAPMPVPVDDAVSLVYEDRYIYLVSGWHDTDNVSLVQVYDTREDNWFEATTFPGPAVFGHAGGIVDNQMVICDGVKVVPSSNGQRSFVASPMCFSGTIDSEHPEKIAWRLIAHYSRIARYRMAAGTLAGKIYFAGGSDNPYNFDGIGYDGVVSKPTAAVFAYDTRTQSWQRANDLPFASMDHRGLIPLTDGFALVGGMDADGNVLSRTVFFRPE